jgi:hypothetical protein
MRKTRTRIAVVATLGAVAAASWWWRPATAQARDIVFKSTLGFRDQSMSIDGASFSEVPCSKNTQQPFVFGTIALDRNTLARLTCADDYLGGISLLYTDKKGEARSLNLAGSDGDAGDAWDRRSWISADTGSLKVLTVSLSSANDTDTGQLLTCKVTQTSYTWDPENKILAESEPMTKLDPRAFTPPIAVVKECLDDRGFWKGK